MALPKLADAQVEWIVQQVGGYIEDQRETYRPGAVPVAGELLFAHNSLR